MSAPTVAIVGLGALGLVTLKNLREEGFDAVGFDRNDYVGGLWHFDQGDKLTVMKSIYQQPISKALFLIMRQ
jgi:dimethylaniline monooxygenase (N-oxide forming)